MKVLQKRFHLNGSSTDSKVTIFTNPFIRQKKLKAVGNKQTYTDKVTQKSLHLLIYTFRQCFSYRQLVMFYYSLFKVLNSEYDVHMPIK